MRIFRFGTLILAVLLTGCAALNPTVAPAPETGTAIQGRVHGGQQPIVGAKVYLLAASSGGVGGISFSLLNNSVFTHNPGNSGQDPLGGFYYVTTDSTGAFSITGDYVCGVNEQLYLYAVGGDSGGGSNPAIGLLAALGTCPNGGTLAGTIPFVAMDEVSTIAAAYSFAGYATSPNNVSSSGTGPGQIGIANAFANVNNLASLATGQALAVTPAGNGTVPQTTINTLANILASCINSTGTFTTCTTLFSNAKSAGSTGTTPTDTAAAAINIAHNPGANVSTLFGLSAPSAPFAPALPLNATPNDFTLGINFTGGTLHGPGGLAIDASGNVWIANDGSGNVVELSNAGAILSGSGYFSGGAQHGFETIAIDPSGNVWAADILGNVLSMFSSAGVSSAFSPISNDGINNPYSLAIDGTGNVWAANASGNNVLEFSSAGAVLSGANGYTGGGITNGSPIAIAIDGNGNAWIAGDGGGIGGGNVSKITNAGTPISSGNGYVVGGFPSSIAIDNLGDAWIVSSTNFLAEISSAGSTLSGFNGFTGGGLNNPIAIAVDGASNVWVANSPGSAASVSEFTNAGAPVTSSTGYTGGGSLNYTTGIAIDGSGNAWMTNSDNAGAGGSVTELVGVATPVVTPLSVGVKNNTLGKRP